MVYRLHVFAQPATCYFSSTRLCLHLSLHHLSRHERSQNPIDGHARCWLISHASPCARTSQHLYSSTPRRVQTHPPKPPPASHQPAAWAMRAPGCHLRLYRPHRGRLRRSSYAVLESGTPITDHARAVGDWPKQLPYHSTLLGRRAFARPPRLMTPTVCIGRRASAARLSQKGCWGGSEHIGGSHRLFGSP